jgi:hypothetical protein
LRTVGFVGWVDQERPLTANNALGKLWRIYHNYISGRINERADNTKLMKITAENTLVEVKKVLDDDEKMAMKENLARTKNNTSTVKELEQT